MEYIKKFVRAIIPRGVRNWLRSPKKSVEWAWDELKYAVGLKSTIEVRPGWLLRCHPGAYGFAYWAQESDQEQVEEFDAFIANCRPGMVLFDIGAHFGLFSLAALHYGGEDARAIAVDPSTTAMRMLRIQAHLNDVGRRLNIVQAAVGDTAGWHEMITVGVVSGGYLIAADKDHPTSEITRIPATTIDKLAEETGVLPTHIKIDVEGNEADVIRGGRHVLSGVDSPVLFLELHNQMIREREGNPEDTLLLLNQFGYETFAVDGNQIDANAILRQPLIRVMAKRSQS